MSDIVHLNVGGTVYTTTRATLTVYEDSMLEKMFNGTWEVTHDDQGRCFVDRDGTLFRYVLNFLRTGDPVIPDEFPELKLLRSEADFYQIPPLIEAVDSEIQRRERNSNVVYYLDVAEKTTFVMRQSGGHVGMSEKEMIICGHEEVIKCLPLDRKIVDFIHRLGDHPRIPTCMTDLVGGTGSIYVASSGNSTEIFAKTLYVSESSGSSVFLGFNRSDLTDALLANNCSLVSSTSELRESPFGADASVFQCCDKWRIPEESLHLLAVLKPYPKLKMYGFGAPLQQLVKTKKCKKLCLT